MKTANSRRILTALLTLTMMLSMMFVFTLSPSAEATDKIYTLDVGDLSVFAAGAKANGDYEKAGTDNFFTVFYSEKAKLEANEKTFSDGVLGTRRFAFGDKSTIGSEFLNAVKFKTEGSSVVKLWWVGGDAGRQPAIFDPNGNVIAKYEGETVKNDMYITEFTLPEQGVYYLGNLKGSNYFYQIQVSDSKNGTPAGPRLDWASVPTPSILSADDDGAGKITVYLNGDIGHNGADEILVHMYKDGQLIDTKGCLNEQSQGHTAKFNPQHSGSYTFVAESVRAGETSKLSTEFTASFVYPLAAPAIASATSKGGGVIQLEWGAVHEAESFEIYQNGAKIDTVNSDTLSYTVSGLTVGQEYSFYLVAIRGGERKQSASASAIASNESKQTWAFTVYGPSTNEKNNGYEGSVNDHGYVTVYSEGGKGKIQPASVDGLAFYYTQIPVEYNFTLRARISVDSWTLSNGQEGFGLLVTDRLGANGDGGNIWNNQYLAGSTKIEYKYNGDTDQIFDVNGDGTKYTMKLGIGTISKTGITKENLPGFEAMDTNTIGENFLSLTTTLDRTGADLTGTAGTYNVIGNFTAEPAGTFDERFLITEYIMEIQKNNTGYFISYYDLNGNLISQKKNYDPDALSHLDEEYVYAGFFASRNARATFSDIEFTTILASEDAPAEEPPVNYITPAITINSANVANNNKYTLIIDPNVDGTLKITYGALTIANNVKVEGNVRYKQVITLRNFDENKIDIEFTPDPDQWLPEFTQLSSTRPVYSSLIIDYSKGNSHRNTIYVSPNVKPYTTLANGTKEFPYDIYTAVDNAYPGQTIILMEGTYKMDSSLRIQRGMNGTEEKPIRMIADPEAATRPVIDFQGLYTGIVHGGNYWYFYGFDVTGSMNKTKGFQISGNHNVLDQIHAYHNGDTGIQISRFAGTDLYEDWPAYNLILNCTSYRNFDAGFEDADGFAAKLTVGPGNVFDGCIAYNNADDGWDLYAKVETGPIGSVTIRNCVAYENGFVPGIDGKTGNGNGFKMGGDSLSGKHVLENSIAFNNLAKGIDSNSCPDIIVKNSISFNNGSYNVALYTNNASNTDFEANGIISFRTEKTNIAENLKGRGTQDSTKFIGQTNFYWNEAEGKCLNSLGQEITADMFVSLVFDGFERNADGSLNLKGFLEIKDSVPAEVINTKLFGVASYEIEILPDAEHNYSDKWFNLDPTGHWYECECGDKTELAPHDFVWIIDKEVVGMQTGLKHQECTVCGFKRAAITTYPEEPGPDSGEVTPPTPGTDVTPDVDEPTDQPEEPKLGFFARIWQAILDFFRRLFGIKKD